MSSGGGWNQIVLNTQERVLSVDANRAQTFKGRDLAEAFRMMYDAVATDDTAPGVATFPNSVETPLRAEILNGGLCRPQIGSLDVLVDPMVVMVMSPDAAPDESNYKYVNDPGVPLTGVLQIAANASGSIRIDVLEAALNPTNAIVTDSRDLFNQTTGLFVASTVTKETKGQLQYRVRQGTPGSGMPANQSGWLPLMVASVPAGSTNNDTVTFWDVRPIIESRLHAPHHLVEDWPLVQRADYVADDVTVGGKILLNGQFRSSIASRRIGGLLRRGTPGTDADNVDLKDAANLASGFAFAGTGFAYVYLVTPFGLPSWSRYTDAPSARVPRAPRGIVVVSSVAPVGMKGTPTSGIPLPDSTGLVGSTTSAACIGAIYVNGGTPHGAVATGRTQWAKTGAGSKGVIEVASTTGTWNLVAGTHYPANAKRLHCSALMQYTVTIGANGNVIGTDSVVDIFQPGGGSALAFVAIGAALAPAQWPTAGAYNVAAGMGMFTVPLLTQYPAGDTGAKLIIATSLSTNIGLLNSLAVNAGASSVLYIHGWDL